MTDIYLDWRFERKLKNDVSWIGIQHDWNLFIVRIKRPRLPREIQEAIKGHPMTYQVRVDNEAAYKAFLAGVPLAN